MYKYVRKCSYIIRQAIISLFCLFNAYVCMYMFKIMNRPFSMAQYSFVYTDNESSDIL